MRNKRRWGIVYFIQRGLNGPIKIGESLDPYRRMSQLQVGSAEPLRMLGMLVEADELEEHAKFAHLRLEGEWFACTDELLEYIETHQMIPA